MKGILLTHIGMEEIAEIDVDELIKQKAVPDTGCVTFPIKSEEDLFKLCYKSQSAGKICQLLSEFEYKDLINSFNEQVKKINWEDHISKQETIQLRVKNLSTKIDLPGVELERELSAAIIDHIQDKHSYKQPVNLKNPDVPILIYITENKCYVGIDYAGFDLSKRSHHIFTHPSDVKGTIGYALFILSEFDENDTLIDCFAGSGTIAIEATLYACNFPVNYYNKEKFAFLKFQKFKDIDFNAFFEKEDKKIINEKFDIYNIDSTMKYINFAKKNAQIAGILKNMEFRRMQLEWFDTKFDKEEVHRIVTKMPVSRDKDTEKNYKELFYQADFVLNKKGTMVLLAKKDLTEKYAKKYNFKIAEEHQIYSGKEQYDVFLLEKLNQEKK